ncbi:hypothetical protein AtEden1_Chr3g0200311 [Arabidopsis thaliana]
MYSIWPTSMWPVSPKSSSNYLDFVSADEVKYATTLDKTYVTNVVSVISNVSPIQSFPWVCRQRETNFARYVSFDITDNM